MLLSLHARNLWMTNDSLKSKEMAVIAFVWKAPARLLHRPTFAKKINDYLGKIELNYEQQNLLKRASNDAELPELPQIFVNLRNIKHGNTNRVETEAPAILAPKPYSRLMKELVSQIPLEDIGYEIVPCGMVAKIGEENYRNALIANNDYNNCIRVIEILYLHKSHFELTVNYQNEQGKIGEWLSNSPLIIDVQPTNRTDEIGKYFVIVQESNMLEARKKVASLLRVFQNNAEAYGNHFPRLPCIANGPLADGAAERAAESLSKKFASLQANPTPPTSTPEITAWSPSRTEVVFDLQSTREFPAVSQDSGSRAKSQVTFPEDTATQSRSLYTTDLDTTVSELKTVFTESIAAQSQMLQQFMQTSQQQHQMLLQATQSQQATTNQLLQHMSSIMATMVASNSPSDSPQAPLPTNPPTVSNITPQATAFQPKTSSHHSPNKRTAPPLAPDRRRGRTPQDSDITMQDQYQIVDPNAAAPILDPDPACIL
jgi:hypothetical protein